MTPLFPVSRLFRRSLIACILCIPVLLLSVFLLRAQTALGYDGYYYALQIRSLERGAGLLYQDGSWVFAFLWFLNRGIADPTLAPRVASVLAALISLGSLYLSSVPARRRAFGLPVILLLGLSPAWFYLHLEFIKNVLGLACLCAFVAVARNAFPEGASVRSSWRARPVRTSGILLLLTALCALSFGAHRQTALLALAFAGARIAVSFSMRAGRFSLRRFLWMVAPPVVLLIYLVVARGWSVYLTDIRFTSPVSRWKFLVSASFSPLESLWFFLYLAGLYGYLAFRVLRTALACLRRPGVNLLRSLFGGIDAGIFLSLSFLCAVPFLPLTTDNLAFRMLLVSPIFFALHVLSLFKSHSETLSPAARAVWASLLAVLMVFSGALWLETLKTWEGRKYPAYADLLEELRELRPQLAGRRLVAHRGLSCALWYEWEIHCESYRTGDESGVRLVYGLRPELFAPYLESGSEASLASLPATQRYTLVEERVWNRFCAAHPDTVCAINLLNPDRERSSRDQSLNPRAVRALSPRTYGDE